MAEIINLRRQRKALVADQAAAQAIQNRGLHGRTKAERERDRLQAERQAKVLDGARREDP